MARARRWCPPALSLSLALALCPACGGADGPEWIALAAGPAPVLGAAQPAEVAHTTPEGRHLRVRCDGEGFWFVTEVPRAAWHRFRGGNTWIVDVPGRSVGAPAPGPPGRLTAADGRTFLFDEDAWGEEGGEQPGIFTCRGAKLLLSLEEGEEPPSSVVLEQYAHPGRATTDGGPRLRGRRFSGEGIALLPGWRVRRVVDVPAGSTLRFATCCERALYGVQAPTPVTFRVWLDGEVLFTHEQDVTNDGTYARHELALPAKGVDGATLEFETIGAPTYTSFLAPVIGPSQVGTYDARPWTGGRPSIVVFLADTFRADNLTMYGGRPEWAPAMNRFAEEGLCFARAWSASTTTLPSHATYFSGLYPPQTATDGLDSPLSEELETIAERLAQWGYRTGAVTDSILVSSAFGMDQGFDVFDEYRDTTASTLERARDFLAADDGRPVFLFVQSYRTHTPYRVSAETRRAIEQRTGVPYTTEYEALEQRLGGLGVEDRASPETAALFAEFETMYRAGVTDLDRAFGEFRTLLRGFALDPGGYVMLLSDHGEAFGEHGEAWHSGRVHEEQVRVPLILHGPGIAPRRSDHGASAVDFAPTLADLAGVPPRDGWTGISLRRLAEERAIFAYQSKFAPTHVPSLAIIEGRRKLIFDRPADELGMGDLRGAYDLETDAGEERDLSGSDVSWPEEMLRRWGATCETHLQPVVEAGTARLDSTQKAALKAMGYGGEQD